MYIIIHFMQLNEVERVVQREKLKNCNGCNTLLVYLFSKCSCAKGAKTLGSTLKDK